MKPFLNFSIKWKIVSMLLVVSSVTLLLACSIFAFNDLRMFKANMIRNLKVLAEAVGKNNQAAIRFEDRDAALQILSSLEAESQVYYAGLYTPKGDLWVYFSPTKNLNSDKNQGIIYSLFSEFIEEKVEIQHPILLNGTNIGTILIKAELFEYKALFATYFYFGLFIFVTALTLSLIISIKLQSIISSPLLKLAATAKLISENHDYSIRVSHNAKDEIGSLYLGFNDMLSQADKRGEELENYKLKLEEKVSVRTKELSRSNEDLKKSLDEKDILLNEIHHRVKNNLQIISSLLRLHSNYTSNEESLETFKECSLRIDSMALLYEKIYGSHNLSEIELEEYLNDLAVSLLSSYGVKNNSIVVKINTHSLSLDIDSIVPCSLIIQELISNSVKHAFPENAKGEIGVSLNLNTTNHKNIELIVSDNGIGLPKGWDLLQTDTLGLQLVKRLSEGQLNGKINVERAKGTCFTIHFPLEETKCEP